MQQPVCTRHSATVCAVQQSAECNAVQQSVQCNPVSATACRSAVTVQCKTACSSAANFSSVQKDANKALKLCTLLCFAHYTLHIMLCAAEFATRQEACCLLSENCKRCVTICHICRPPPPSSSYWWGWSLRWSLWWWGGGWLWWWQLWWWWWCYILAWSNFQADEQFFVRVLGLMHMESNSLKLWWWQRWW